ncbi:MAG: S9 family peptidase [Alphaproteobacteria bacterium]
MSQNPPIAAQKQNLIEQHGIQRNDPYSWLKAENWQEVMQDPSVLDPEIREYLEAENAYTNEFMTDTEAAQELLVGELRGRIKEDDASVPVKDGPYLYVSRYETGAQYPVFLRHKLSKDYASEQEDLDQYPAQTEVILDGNVEAEGSSYFALAAVSHSPNHKLLGIAVDKNGSEYYDLEIRDLAKKKVVDVLTQISGDFEWCADNKSIVYTTLDDSHRPSKVYLHKFGDERDTDELLYEETDPGFFIGLSKSESGKFLFINSHQHDTSEIYVLSSQSPTPPTSPVRKRETGIEYELHHHDDTFLIWTNVENAENFKIMTASVNSVLESRTEGTWKDLIGASSTNTIVDISVYKDFMVRLERVRALPQLVITRFEDGQEHRISFEEEAFSLGLSGSYEYDTDQIRFSYSSPTSPSRVYDYNMATRERTLRKEQVIPSGHDNTAYVTKRFFAKSHDGLEIPITLLQKSGSASAKPQPVLLYAYGSYGSSTPASFSSSILSLVDRGFTYAIAHVRGGAEMGQAWYKGGRGHDKPNTFHDFISVAENLIDRGYASKGEISIHGGSAGGMLVGAVVNMRPDLFKTVIAQVPFVDVLTTMSDTSLPLTPIEWPEWGNPIASQKAYERIQSYSPIDQVSDQEYPAIFAIAGLTDPRVTYWEPAKWVATLRDKNTSQNPILLKTNMESGHGGASGRFDRLKETALIYAFLLKFYGLSAEIV